jgi:hypothetical protein
MVRLDGLATVLDFLNGLQPLFIGYFLMLEIFTPIS